MKRKLKVNYKHSEQIMKMLMDETDGSGRLLHSLVPSTENARCLGFLKLALLKWRAEVGQQMWRK